MRIGLCLDPGRPWSDLATLARRADDAGWDSLYVCDHFMPADPSGPGRLAPMFEGWTTLSALAAITTRVRLGPLVLGNGYRHPAVVANMAATFDHVSAGRLVLGIGAGWQENEHLAYGIDLPGVRERLDRFAEACALLVGLLHHPPLTFDGTYYRLRDAPCDPRPVQPHLPILIGGGGERRTMRIAAEWADEWHDWTDPETFRRKSAVLDGHCADVGRDPSTIRRLTGQVVEVLTTPGRGRRPADDESSSDVVGTRDQVVEQLVGYRDAGVDEFVVCDTHDQPLEQALGMVDALGGYAVPVLRTSSD